MSRSAGSGDDVAVEASGLTKVFRSGSRKRRSEVVAVDGISFVVHGGERVAYIGPNGAGKSTSIKMLTGVLYPSSGDATVLGLQPWTQRRQLTRRIGTLFGQRSQLWFELTPNETFRALAAIYGIDDERLAARIAELGDLLEARNLFDMPVRTLSLGQRMRCELAACLLHEPQILFLDEPTIGLDLLAKQRFRELLVRLNEEHRTTVFLTSHDVADIEHLANRAIVINHGTVIYDGQVAAMRRSLLATKIVDVTLAVPGALPAVEGVTVVDHTDTTVTLLVDLTQRSIRDVLDEVLRELRVSDVSVTDPPLEDVIADIYSRPVR